VVSGGCFAINSIDAWDYLKNFFLAGGGSSYWSTALVFWLLGRSLRPIGKILGRFCPKWRAALRTRCRKFELPEFDAISHTLTAWRKNLEQSLRKNQRLALGHQSNPATPS